MGAQKAEGGAVDALGEREAPLESTVRDLADEVVLVRSVRPGLALASDGEDVIHPRPATSSSAAAKPTAGNSWVGNSGDSLPQQLDRAEDRGDYHHHRAGDADRQNVIQHRVPELAFTAGLPVERALECPERDGLSNDGLSGKGSPYCGRI
jgi:hypothetical protein